MFVADYRHEYDGWDDSPTNPPYIEDGFEVFDIEEPQEFED